jgi:hypothetical protein
MRIFSNGPGTRASAANTRAGNGASCRSVFSVSTIGIRYHLIGNAFQFGIDPVPR